VLSRRLSFFPPPNNDSPWTGCNIDISLTLHSFFSFFLHCNFIFFCRLVLPPRLISTFKFSRRHAYYLQPSTQISIPGYLTRVCYVLSLLARTRNTFCRFRETQQDDQLKDINLQSLSIHDNESNLLNRNLVEDRAEETVSEDIWFSKSHVLLGGRDSIK
jgi:hypothetical protein